MNSMDESRVIRVGEPHPGYPFNRVKTAKYTLWSFLPLNLFS